MNQSHLALAVMAFLFSAPAMAATCNSSRATTAQDLSVATQEMRRDTSSNTSCVTAQEAIARASRSKKPSAESASASKSSASGYVPKTKFDNTPWRFDMNQNGKRMTAEEFDAWMKAKGIRIATGKPAAAALDEKALANDRE